MNEEQDYKHVELLGVHLVADPPVGQVQLEFRQGLTALYGKNGAGKTRVLAELGKSIDALNALPYGSMDSYGERIEPEYDYASMPRPLETLYYHSGFHIRCPMTATFGSSVAPALTSAAERFGFESDKWDTDEPILEGLHVGWDDIVLYVMSRLPFEANVDDVEYLLDAGRWIVAGSEVEAAVAVRTGPLRRPAQGALANCERRVVQVLPCLQDLTTRHRARLLLHNNQCPCS